MSTLLKVENIEKIYITRRQKIHVLKGISFEIHEGEIFSLLGINGAGKTTLSSIIATLLKPTAGDVLFKGKSVYKHLYEYREALGFCPQKQNIDKDLTIEENLKFAGRYYGLSKKRIEYRTNYLIEKFKLQDYAKERSEILSGGYKQRFLIARSLVHEPKLVILDEPTVGLDPQVREHLIKFIASLKEEKITIILTTHYLDESEKLSDRVCVIDKGKVKAIDSPKNLKHSFNKSNLNDVFLQLLEEEKKEQEEKLE